MTLISRVSDELKIFRILTQFDEKDKLSEDYGRQIEWTCPFFKDIWRIVKKKLSLETEFVCDVSHLESFPRYDS